MRRRNKPKVVWLPQTNANSLGAGDSVYQLAVIEINGATGTSSTFEIPLVLDSSQSAVFTTDSSLADIESSGYRLRRIVGKLYAECAQTPRVPGTVTPTSAIVTAGIIVRRASFDGLSYASQVGDAEINTGLIDNTGDPWVWRRTWTLGNNNAAQLLNNDGGGGLESLQHFPTNNFYAYAGGNADGTHIDQKTARVVGPEERLFMDVSATILGEANPLAGSSPITIALWTDIRVLGSMRTSVGNRRNASR